MCRQKKHEMKACSSRKLSKRVVSTGLFYVLLVLMLGLPATTEAMVTKQPPPTSSSKKMLILGLGRVGLQCARVALQQQNGFSSVIGTVRGTSTPAAATSKGLLGEEEFDGIKLIPFEIESIQTHLQDSTHVLWTIPLPRRKRQQANSQDPSTDEISLLSSDASVSTLQEAMQLIQKTQSQQEKTNNSVWTGFLSTTGVYGNHNGDWVTEDSDCLTNGNANSYLEVEPNFQYVFRCAGIYDSTRSALHTLYEQGAVKTADTSNITNRIHSLDIAKAVIAAMMLQQHKRNMPMIYNLADDKPATRNEVFDYATQLFEQAGISIPPSPGTISSEPLTGRARRRQLERKLVSNQRMKDKLLPIMTYPTYMEGLKAIIHDPDTPWNQR